MNENFQYITEREAVQLQPQIENYVTYFPWTPVDEFLVIVIPPFPQHGSSVRGCEGE